MIEEDHISESKKKNIKAIILVLVALSIVIPFTFLSLLITPDRHGEEFLTYKEFQDNHQSMRLKDGDIVFIMDVFSDIWYNRSTGFTYMAFKSMDATRTAPWGYDAGIPEDITGEFGVWDKVVIELEIEEDLDPMGNPRLIAHIADIEKI